MPQRSTQREWVAAAVFFFLTHCMLGTAATAAANSAAQVPIVKLGPKHSTSREHQEHGGTFTQCLGRRCSRQPNERVDHAPPPYCELWPSEAAAVLRSSGTDNSAVFVVSASTWVDVEGPNCLEDWWSHRAAVDGTVDAARPPPWWHTRHARTEGGAARAIFVGSGWWTCTFPSSPPFDSVHNVELRCGRAPHLGVVTTVESNQRGLLEALPAPCGICNRCNSTPSRSTSSSLFCQVVYSRAPRDWVPSATSLRWLMGFVGAIAVCFFASMVYIIASPTYHRKMVSLRLAKKFDELEDWVASKETNVHRMSEEGNGAEFAYALERHPSLSSPHAAERRRAQRLSRHGLLLNPPSEPQCGPPPGAKAPQGACSTAPHVEVQQQRRVKTNANLGSSTALYKNPNRRTLGELLLDSQVVSVAHRRDATKKRTDGQQQRQQRTMCGPHESAAAMSQHDDEAYWAHADHRRRRGAVRGDTRGVHVRAPSPRAPPQRGTTFEIDEIQ